LNWKNFIIPGRSAGIIIAGNSFRGVIYTPLLPLVKNGNPPVTGACRCCFGRGFDQPDLFNSFNEGTDEMQSQLQALLFDVDGTLADTEEVHRQAFNAAFSEAGLDWFWSHERYHELLSVTGGKERIRFYLDQYRPDFQLPPDADEFIAGLHRSKTEHYVSILTKGEVPLRPGVERLIREAHISGLRLAIVTTTTPANVSALFEHSFGVHEDEWFELVAAGGVVPQKKPAPDIYNYALEKMGLRADECLALEDSGNGVLSARAAGIDVVVTVNQYTDQHDFSQAALVLDHLGEPDMPCTMLKGKLQPGAVIDTDYLRRLHAVCRTT
jgi:HAD superfamily hydrolase (TIGR01509 family)